MFEEGRDPAGVRVRAGYRRRRRRLWRRLRRRLIRQRQPLHRPQPTAREGGRHSSSGARTGTGGGSWSATGCGTAATSCARRAATTGRRPLVELRRSIRRMKRRFARWSRTYEGRATVHRFKVRRIPVWGRSHLRSIAWCESRNNPRAVAAAGPTAASTSSASAPGVSSADRGDPAAAPRSEQTWRAWLLLKNARQRPLARLRLARLGRTCGPAGCAVACAPGRAVASP